MYTDLVLYTLAAGVLYAVWQISPFIYRSLTTPLRKLPGPPSDSLLYGNFKAIFNTENSVLQEKWLEQYGDTIAYPAMFHVRP